MRTSRSITTLAAVVLTLGCASVPGQVTAASPGPAGAAAEVDSGQRAPQLKVRVIKRGLDIPWDLTFLPSGSMLYTQRTRRTIRYQSPSGRDHAVHIKRGGMWASDETGLMSILAARNFAETRHFFTCHGSNSSRPSGHDVRVVMWRLGKDARRAVRVRQIVTGLPAGSGRHGGCRLRFGREGALYIGTGDAAMPKNAQSLRSGGGKVLRVHPSTGRAWDTNPFVHAGKAIKRRIYTYGHRNVQGLAQRPGREMWSVEHGSYRDDEVNRLRKGGNYGWDPGPGYDETVPMTDFSLPGKQIGARWKSGTPTLATSGAVWLRGNKWGAWQGALAVAALKDTSLRIMKFTPRGKFQRMWTPAALNGSYRLRSPVLGPDKNLYVTTANGGGTDRILKVVPHR